jgi:predicted lipid-binding transport protein (Tim44 family)
MFAQPNVTPFPATQNNPLTSMFGGGGQAAAAPMSSAPVAAPASAVEIGLVQADRDAFERLLAEVQAAFGREDYAALRQITTPEIMSYLSEELSQNAVQGRRNEVSQTKLLQADVAEAWNEGEADYATTAMRYESIDVMRDRQSGAVVQGDPNAPTQTTELWTFVRTPGQPWKLSAIQEA